MKSGVFVTVTERTIDVVRLARKLEELGFESLWLPDHILMPGETHSATPGGGDPPEAYRRLPDPLVLLAAAAGATSTLRLGTAVLVLPVRHPLIAAKQVATLDLVSGGRASIGVGSGWVREEAEIFGTDFDRRWARAREHVLAMKACWAPGLAAYAGEFVRFPELWCEPKPVQQPHPPVIVASDGDQAIARVADFGDGWMAHAARSTPDAIEAGRRRLERLFAENGRDFSRFEVTLFGGKAERATTRTYADAGVDRIVYLAREEAPEATVKRLERWAAEVL